MSFSYNHLKNKPLPSKILPIKCPDKIGLDDAWTAGRDPLNYPVFRQLLVSPPGSGKSTVLKNQLLRMKFQRIYVVLPKKSESVEWNECTDPEYIFNSGEIPDIPTIAKDSQEIKTIIIFDDVNFDDLNKEQQTAIISLWRHYSSHYGIWCAVTCHNFSDVDKTLRRSSNLFTLFGNVPDLVSMQQVFQKSGITKDKFERLWKLCKSNHDHIQIDLIKNSKDFKLRVRFNSVTPVLFREDLVEEKKKKK